MMRLRIIYSILSLSVLASCACGSGGRKVQSVAVIAFPSVDVPVMLQDDYGKVSYFLTENFWNRFFDPQREWAEDTSAVCGVRKADLVAAVGDYVFVLNSLVSDPAVFAQTFPVAEKGIVSLLDRATAVQDSVPQTGILPLIAESLEKYLYDPNSPLRHEDLYGVVAGYLAESDLMDEYVRERYRIEKMRCDMNPTGAVAADFNYITDRGRLGSLHTIDAEYTVMFFSNPGCDACRQIVGQLSSLEVGDRLAVLNIYIDSDLDAWREYLVHYPAEWINAFDPDGILKSDVIYSVRAIPSLYLLDRDKKVLFKDAVPEKVVAYLQSVL